jgi:hypothetical protein
MPDLSLYVSSYRIAGSTDLASLQGEGFMAGGLNLYTGLGAEAEYRAHLGHEQLTALV